MVYGAEVHSQGMAWQTGELKTKQGIINRLLKANIIEVKFERGHWQYIAKPDCTFVLYCRTEWKNPYDKSAYSKLEGNMRGSWEF